MEGTAAVHFRKPWLPLLVTLSLVLALGGMVGWQWHGMEQRSQEEQQQRFSLAVDEIEQNLGDRMRAYEMVLRGLSGLWVGSERVTSNEWQRATDQLQLQDRYPGIQALGWAHHLDGAQLEGFLDQLRADGLENFRVFPPGERSHHLIVRYVNPLDWRNRRLLGFDLLSEEARRLANEQARDSGEAVLSGPLRRELETEGNFQTGVSLFLPVYDTVTPLITREERRAAWVGTVFAAFRIRDLLRGILGPRDDRFHIELIDVGAVGGTRLSEPGERPAAPRFQRVRDLTLYGRTWQLRVSSKPAYELAASHNRSAFSLWTGMLAAVLFSLLGGGYFYLRERALLHSQRLGEELREREEGFRQLIERLPVATLLCNAQGRIELANQSAAELFGCSQQALLGERVRRYLPNLSEPLTLPDEVDPRAELLEYQAQREDGESVPVALSLTGLAREDGLRFLLNLIDLQARKGAEERFRLVVEASPNAIVLVDSEGLIAMVNRQTEQMFGYSRQELLGQPVEMLLPDTLRANHRGMREGYLRSPEPRRMGGNRELFGQHRDGHSIPLEVGLAPLRSGDKMLVQASIIDISERKAAEERFRLVVEASPNAIVLVDASGRIAMVNRQTEQMFGYSRQELLGEPVERLLPEAQRVGHVALREGYLQSPEPRRMGGNRQLYGQHRDGHSIPLEVGLAPLRSGSDRLVQASIIDISERKATEERLREQAEQLAQANRYKSEFLANMSHELRTPLNSILILSDQLKQNNAGNLSERQMMHAEIINRAGSDLLRLINDVLDLAKVEAGRMQLKLEPMDVRDMVSELDASLRPMAELKGLRLLTEVAPDVPQVIQSDRVRLHQILRNLLSNALKFTETGEVELYISTAPEDAEGHEWLSLMVRDTGIGIPAQQHERIFQAFQQLDGSTSRRFGGTGLGLAITRQLVEVLGGVIDLESAPGAGARFTVRLPVTIPGEEPQAAVEAIGEEPLRGGDGPALLIVEDDRNFAAVIAEEAHGHGFSSVRCSNGRQALELLRHERFVAVILDMVLPDISGWQIYRHLRGQADYRDVPVHIISCMPPPQGWHDESGSYLVKPIARQDLQQVFHELADSAGAEPPRLLLVEDGEEDRERVRGQLVEMGFDVVEVNSAEAAREAYAQAEFAALVIDLDLPDEDGFKLLDDLHRTRSLRGVRVVLNTGVDVSQQELQRLRHYSAAVVHKDTDALGAAVQGFLDDLEHSRAQALGEQELASLRGQRVLLVDDDVRNLYAMSALLEEIGLEVIPAKDGLDAINCYTRYPCDLILMDMAMPNLDGYAATKELKQEHSCRIPIIALTAHAMKGDREHCLAAGADDYLAKPVDRQELLGLLYRWLSGAAAMEPEAQRRQGQER